MTDQRLTERLKRQVVDRAGGCCEYCRSQARFAMQPFSIEHIEPRSLEGMTALENLALSCQVGSAVRTFSYMMKYGPHSGPYLAMVKTISILRSHRPPPSRCRRLPRRRGRLGGGRRGEGIAVGGGVHLQVGRDGRLPDL